jgi:hypothetical protein
LENARAVIASSPSHPPPSFYVNHPLGHHGLTDRTNNKECGGRVCPGWAAQWRGCLPNLPSIPHDRRPAIIPPPHPTTTSVSEHTYRHSVWTSMASQPPSGKTAPSPPFLPVQRRPPRRPYGLSLPRLAPPAVLSAVAGPAPLSLTPKTAGQRAPTGSRCRCTCDEPPPSRLGRAAIALAGRSCVCAMCGKGWGWGPVRWVNADASGSRDGHQATAARRAASRGRSLVIAWWGLCEKKGQRVDRNFLNNGKIRACFFLCEGRMNGLKLVTGARCK